MQKFTFYLSSNEMDDNLGCNDEAVHWIKKLIIDI